MASKRTLKASNLEALGAAVLAELLIEVSGGNAVIQRRLRLALAAAEGSDAAAQDVRKRLSAMDRASSLVDSRRRKALVSELEAQLQAISGPIATADPKLACDLLLRLLELAEGVLQRCTGNTSTVVAVFERAVKQLGPLAQAAQLEPEALVEQVAELLAENGHEQFDGLVPVLSEALGQSGLKRLESSCRQRGGRNGDTHLLQIALARGDVEGYLAQFDAEDLRWRDIAAGVAQQLLSCERTQQALEILDAATEAAPGVEDSAWHDSRMAVLEALNRRAEAQEVRWQWFSHSLSIPHLRDYLQRLDDFADVEAEERALQLAGQHPESLRGLQFLVAWPALSRAARHVLAHAREWNGEAYTIHCAAAERLGAQHPLAATLLLRPLVVFALEMGRNKRYRYAAEQLRSCDQLAARIDDWQGHPDHATYVERLHDRFGGTWQFWERLE
ncbi:hypothetical protein IQ216_02720 [Cyanobium sp. LEGE 06143]|uniref:DUF6880 family protein n=1 Tax=Cyanobium sp. LEGE 06143 TaxID=945727 RepID=UPI001880E15E|nr:hypothetical protein [Cyanobium sp. LEGE 06143]